MLEVGKKAPPFSLKSDAGHDISLKDFIGNTVILYFYPKDSTSGCTQQACDFRDHFEEFLGQKTIILGISKDSEKSHQRFKEKFSLPFILLSDPESEVCKMYDVWKEKSLYGRKYMGAERTTFVISPSGIIKRIYPKVKIKGHIEEILRDLKSN